MDVFDQIATGMRPPVPATRAGKPQPSQRDLQLGYALAKKVPDMQQRGFTIETAYGEIAIEPGPAADAIADIVRAVLHSQLSAADQIGAPA